MEGRTNLCVWIDGWVVFDDGSRRHTPSDTHTQTQTHHQNHPLASRRRTSSSRTQSGAGGSTFGAWTRWTGLRSSSSATGSSPSTSASARGAWLPLACGGVDGSTTGQARGYIALTDFPSLTYEHNTQTHHLCRNSPIFGVVHVPAMEPAKTYYGVKGKVHTHTHTALDKLHIYIHPSIHLPPSLARLCDVQHHTIVDLDIIHPQHQPHLHPHHRTHTLGRLRRSRGRGAAGDPREGVLRGRRGPDDRGVRLAQHARD